MLIFFNYLFPLLLFLPGIALIELFKDKLHLTFLERVIAGSTSWLFIFSFISLLLGVFTNYLLTFFNLFSYLSIGVLIIFAGLKGAPLLKKIQPFNIKVSSASLHSGLFIIPIVSV